MDFEYIYPVLILFGSFAVMLAIGVPITFAIGLSSLLSIITALPPDAAISVISQKMTVGLDGFTLLAIPFFVLAGNIMNLRFRVENLLILHLRQHFCHQPTVNKIPVLVIHYRPTSVKK